MTLPEAERHLSLAAEAVVSRCGAMVRRVGRRYRLDEADVDEVMQEVRIRLWRSQGSSEQIGEVNTSYVYRTASEAAPDPHGELESSEVAAQVARAIETIPASRRPVVRMYLTGHPREEIAQLMGWTEGKTRNLLYRE